MCVCMYKMYIVIFSGFVSVFAVFVISKMPAKF